MLAWLRDTGKVKAKRPMPSYALCGTATIWVSAKAGDAAGPQAHQDRNASPSLRSSLRPDAPNLESLELHTVRHRCRYRRPNGDALLDDHGDGRGDFRTFTTDEPGLAAFNHASRFIGRHV